MIEVRIRLSGNAAAVRLCYWPSTDLDALIPALRRWGVETEFGPCDVFTGQFVVNDDTAYFEVVLFEDGDDD